MMLYSNRNKQQSRWVWRFNKQSSNLLTQEVLAVYGGKDLIWLRTKILSPTWRSNARDLPQNSPAKIVLYHVEPNRQLVNNRNERESWRASKFNKQSGKSRCVWWERFDSTSYQNTKLRIQNTRFSMKFSGKNCALPRGTKQTVGE